MSRRDFFDSVANHWDEMLDLERIQLLVQQGLESFNIKPNERVLDLGCGTGVLIGCLLEHLGPQGKIEAVDFSSQMLLHAAKKHVDPRICFSLADATLLPFSNESIDRIICLSCWPHFPNPNAVIIEMHRTLKPNGFFHVWHVDSRETINNIHKNADQKIHDDILEDAQTLSQRIRQQGFLIIKQQDNKNSYLVTAQKAVHP